MTEIDQKPTHTMDDVATWIKDLREVLLIAGFRHANEAGELVSADNTTMVGTTYVFGEYSIYAWRRPRGYAEISEVRHVMRVRVGTDPAAVIALGKRLSLWAKKPPTRGNFGWPVEGLGATKT